MAEQSLLITVANRGFDGIDLEGFASSHGLSLARIDAYGTNLKDIYDADLLARGPVLVVGTGDLSFDAELAAALGIPVVLVVGETTNVELAKRRLDDLGAVLAAAVPAEELTDAQLAGVEATQVMSPIVFESWLIKRAKEKRAHIVLPEGEDDRILQAADQLLADDVAEITILGDVDDITRRADGLGLDLGKAHLLNHLESDLLEEFAADFAELRKKKGITLDEARETVKDISYFGTMMVHKGIADGMVSGAAHTTAHTIKPSFQIIKTSPGASVVSSIFLMVMRGRLWAFGDCAVNPNPTAEQIGEIAAVSARTAAQFGIDPKVAILSSST